jgi:RNA polymerase sigma-70 factor (ECF subfamily)
MTGVESGDWRLDELLKTASGGDQAAMAAVFDRYRGRLARMLRIRIHRRHQAVLSVDEVLQETYLVASRRLEEFLRKRKMPFYLWLRYLAFQKLVELQRGLDADKRGGGKVQQFPSLAAPGDGSTAGGEVPVAGTGPSPSSAAIQGEVGEMVREVLQQLREEDREVLLLRHFEMLSNAETAQVLGTSEAAASQRHLRALGRLRNLLQKYPGLKSYFS